MGYRKDKMGKYDSPGQIFGLFAGAALVAMGVIFVLNIEANKRYGTRDEDVIVQERNINPTPSLARRVLNKLRSFGVWFKSDGNNDEANKVHLRQKRSVIYLPEGAGEDFNENESEDEFDLTATQLSENLLSQSLNGHKIRNVVDKVKHLDPVNDQIVSEILRQFCPKPEKIPEQPINESSPMIDENMQNETLDFQSQFTNIQDVKSTTPTVQDEVNTNATRLHLHFARNNEEKAFETVFVCEDYGNTVLTVLITTAVNITFLGLILFCKQFLNNWPPNIDEIEDELNCCNIRYGHENLQEEFYDDEIYGIPNETSNQIYISESPIIKTSVI